MLRINFINILLLFFICLTSERLSAQTVLNKKSGAMCGDSASTSAINIATGEIVNTKDIKKENSQSKLLKKNTPINYELINAQNQILIIDPKNFEKPENE